MMLLGQALRLNILLWSLGIILGRLLRSWRWLNYHYRDGIAQLHHLLHYDLDCVYAGGLKLGPGKNSNVGRTVRRVTEDELGLAFAHDGFLIGRDEPDIIVKLTHTGHPAGEHAQFAGDDRQLGHADGTDDA